VCKFRWVITAPDIEDLKSEIATNFRKVFEARYND